MIDCVTFGLILDDIVLPDGTTHMGVLGGGGAQTAWGMAAALGSGASVGLVAGVGADLDAAALAPLRAAGIDLSGVRVSDLPTPRAWQVTEADGRRTQVWRVPPQTLGAQLARRWDVLPEAYRAARRFHWGDSPGRAGSRRLRRRTDGGGAHRQPGAVPRAAAPAERRRPARPAGGVRRLLAHLGGGDAPHR
ncbi:MAG: hypothetical protein M5U29_17900 [Anaerolineae bacterium]|nr:hypothetical protein [Anaerolineae bacterium]